MTKLVGSGEVASLRRQFLQLQRDWHTYKQSAPPRSHRTHPVALASSVVAPATPPVITELLDRSPKQLLSSLQQDESPTEVWGVRSVDWDAEEIVLERKAAIKSGRLRGRSLLEALEDAREHAAAAVEPRKNGDVRSARPSVLVHGRGEGRPVRSSSCSCSCSACSSCSSSSDLNHHRYSSSSFSPERVEGEKAVGAKSGGDGVAGDGGGRRMVGMAWLAMLLMVLSLGVIFLMGLHGEEDGRCLIPT